MIVHVMMTWCTGETGQGLCVEGQYWAGGPWLRCPKPPTWATYLRLKFGRGVRLPSRRLLLEQGGFLFLYFLFPIFTKIYFRFINLQKYTSATRQPASRGLSAKKRRKKIADRSLGPVARLRGGRPPLAARQLGGRPLLAARLLGDGSPTLYKS